jgi:ABC-type sugar transport system permease subunit
VAFLLPFARRCGGSWMIGKSMLEYRYGPVSRLLRLLGWENPSLLTSPWLAKTTIAAMDAWVWIPFMMILLLAGLQALSKEVQEAAKVDGATGWQGFWQITFPSCRRQRDGHCSAHHLPAQARRYCDQHHIGRTGWRNRYGFQLCVP